MMAKAASALEIPPPLEMRCLNALWALGEANVSDVRRAVSESRPLAYTTVMTLLERLTRKGIVSRRKVGRAFVYAPSVTQQAIRRIALREFVQVFFDGSEDRLVEFIEGVSVLYQPSEANAPNGASLDTALL
jgi:BlaI family transcriptional regulator, penicillinase repressor